MRGASFDARLLEPRLDLLAIPLGRKRRPIFERRADLPQRAVARLERQRFSRGKRLDLPAELLQAAKVLLLESGACLLVLVLLLLENRNRSLEALGRNQIGRCVLAQHVCIAAQPAPARHHVVHRLLGCRELFELGGE